MKKSKKKGVQKVLWARKPRSNAPVNQKTTVNNKTIWCDAALQLWVHLGFGSVGSTDQKVNPHPTRMNQQ
jgi:hypothetical protein